jgi:ubiquinone/menaquinone biosynthesis C-methylase UbiE
MGRGPSAEAAETASAGRDARPRRPREWRLDFPLAARLATEMPPPGILVGPSIAPSGANVPVQRVRIAACAGALARGLLPSERRISVEVIVHPLYHGRKLSQGYPNLDRLAFEKFSGTQEAHHAVDTAGIERQLMYLNRLADLETGNVVVVGCGPKPRIVKFLLERGYQAVGVEPIPAFLRAAREFLGDADKVLSGSAESIPLPDASQHLVYCGSVLEHVDSPSNSLAEMFRVLAPSGIAFITTTNRHHVSWLGRNAEFNVRYYNWLPPLVKECFVFNHLHFDPRLANYTERPAVHWYSHADLCKLGRDAGFAQFYSPVDWIRVEDPPIANRPIRRLLLGAVQTNPWLRAFALAVTEHGGVIAMLKRAEPAAREARTQAPSVSALRTSPTAPRFAGR